MTTHEHKVVFSVGPRPPMFAKDGTLYELEAREVERILDGLSAEGWEFVSSGIAYRFGRVKPLVMVVLRRARN